MSSEGLIQSLMDDSLYLGVGERIRTRRRHLELTLEDVGAATGLHAAYIGQLERGRKKCSVRVLAALAAGLRLRVGDLFEDGKAARLSSGERELSILLLSANPRERALIVSTVRHFVRSLRKLR